MLIDTVEFIQRLEPATAVIGRPRSGLAILGVVMALSGLIGHCSPPINYRL